MPNVLEAQRGAALARTKLEAGQPSLNACQVDLPSCSLMSVMLSSTRRKKNDGNVNALGDPR